MRLSPRRGSAMKEPARLSAGRLSDTSSRYHLVFAVKKLLHSIFQTLTWCMSMVVSHTRLHFFGTLNHMHLLMLPPIILHPM